MSNWINNSVSSINQSASDGPRSVQLSSADDTVKLNVQVGPPVGAVVGAGFSIDREGNVSGSALAGVQAGITKGPVKAKVDAKFNYSYSLVENADGTYTRTTETSLSTGISGGWGYGQNASTVGVSANLASIRNITIVESDGETVVSESWELETDLDNFAKDHTKSPHYAEITTIDSDGTINHEIHTVVGRAGPDHTQIHHLVNPSHGRPFVGRYTIPNDKVDGYFDHQRERDIGTPSTGGNVSDDGGWSPNLEGEPNRGDDSGNSGSGAGNGGAVDHGYDHSGSGGTTGDFTPSGGAWNGGNGNQNHGTPEPGLPENPDYSGVQPILLDLGGANGVEISFENQTVFDWDGDGFLEQTAWAGSQDGFLVIDLNPDGTRGDGGGDGVIDQAEELSFAAWGEEGQTDLEALAHAFDQNDDGVLNVEDGQVWTEMRVWQDLNQDGVTDTGELKSLSDWKITEINLRYDNGSAYGDDDDDIQIFDNTLYGFASFTMDDKIVEGGVADLSLRYSTLGYREIETDFGTRIEFETGEVRQYAHLEGKAYESVDLDDLALDGAQGDVDENLLDASGHSRFVQIAGGDGNDTVIGGNNDDFLSGDDGVDSIRGGNGNDLIFADAADFGAGGHVAGGVGYDTLRLVGATGINIVLAEHELEAVYGADTLDGVSGSASDTLSGSGLDVELVIDGRGGNDSIVGGLAGDHLNGGDGRDTLRGGNGGDLISGGADNDVVLAQNGDDLAFGGLGDDRIEGGDGDDFVSGGEGDDTLSGDSHDDIVSGDAGNDQLDGGSGDDTLRGGEGNDTLSFWLGDDSLEGGDGDDRFVVSDAGYGNFPTVGWAVLQGGKGNDIAYIDLPSSNYSLQKVLSGTSTNQWQIVWFDAVGGAVSIVDLQDVETLEFSDGVTHTLSTNIEADTAENYSRTNSHIVYGDSSFQTRHGVRIGDEYGWEYGHRESREQRNSDGVETYSVWITDLHEFHLDGETGNDFLVGQLDHGDLVIGGEGADVVYGAGGDDTLRGGSGSDRIHGDTGNDLVNGGSGADDIKGGAGNDTLFGNTGSDVLHGEDGNDLINGNSGDDYLTGGADDDTLVGNDGTDTLFGGLGQDHLLGGNGADLLSGNEGNDSLEGKAGSDMLYGGAGNDTLDGGQGFDALYGGDGDDDLDGGLEDDWLSGGSGADTLKGGDGRDVLNGGEGADVLNGGGGLLDAASYQGSAEAVQIDLAANTAGGGDAAGDVLSNIENVIGSDHDDVLAGNDVDNVLEGADGDDTLNGGAGHDSFIGGDGNDNITGGEGDDRAWGDKGNDLFNAGEGDDQFFGGEGSDTVYGSGGNDTLVGDAAGASLKGLYYQYYSAQLSDLNQIATSDVANTGMASDLNVEEINIRHGGGDAFGLQLHGRLEIDVAGNYEFTIGQDDRVRILVDGNQAYQSDAWGTGSVMINLTAGNHDLTILYLDHGGPQSLAIEVSGPGTPGAVDLFDSNLLGNPEYNSTVMNLFADDLYGGTGDDSLNGGIGHDTLRGGTGDDTIFAGSGNDSVWGHDGRDVVNLGRGHDVFFDNGQDGADGSDSVRGGDGHDTLSGAGGADTLKGDRGDDSIEGGSGDDILLGGVHRDTITGGTGNDRMYGQQGYDYLDGGDGDDKVSGGYHSDTIIGGAGDDQLIGGTGDDMFIFHGGVLQGNDTITDFSDGTEKIKMYDLNYGDLTITSVGAGSRVSWNDGSIQLDGIDRASLNQDDFIFV
ncbi:calcium-binding protein [Phaeobacter inhibens]|uniref:calcium-binding protein n=1 Tax=Phaeobacter inhibens TaxID=221822 RepID=UPI0021A85837|nr:calcium-binding protein [Phaeobacter inhibens]